MKIKNSMPQSSLPSCRHSIWQCGPRQRGGRKLGISLLLALAFVCALVRSAAFAGTPSALTGGATSAPATAPDDFDAEQRDLERQKQEIDAKLAELAARRHRLPSATQPSANRTSTSLPAAPEGKKPGTPEQATPQAEPIQTASNLNWYDVHGQFTVISQKHDAFSDPYNGPRSLMSDEPFRTSVTGTLFMGAHLPWKGGEAYFDPEIAGGEGFSGVQGIAGFPNGEIPRVASPNQLAGEQDISRLTVTLGKFSAVDYFQQSAYANDPRSQFENWGLFTDGAWDYPADTRGYTEGAVFELNGHNWTLRYGLMAEPKTANGGTLDSRILDALGHSLEYEQRWTLGKHPGSAKLMGFVNRSDAGKYREAIDNPGPNGPDVTLSRTFRDKYGIGLTIDQELTDDLGAFTRMGWNDGHSETWAFTEIDRSVAVGLSLKGTKWHHPDDVIGLAGTINWLSKDHRDYLGAGGLGFIIGDGQLPDYAPEEIIETYYNFKLAEHVFVTPDFQFVDHPAYNADRGPVFIGGVRVHVEF